MPTAGLFVKLDDRDLEAKVKALELYKTQLKHPDNPLSTKGVMTMAAFRGLQCGASAAEAFQIGRLVV